MDRAKQLKIMDTNSCVPNKMNQKGERRTDINDLPDGLLPVILSNLPTKEAVKTGGLSKRWKNQWKDIYKLELVETPGRRQEFLEFVDKLIRECNNSSNMKKFSLTADIHNDAVRVNVWLFAFIKPDIEVISLELDRIYQPLRFPRHVLNSSTLKKLQLSMPVILSFPSYTSLPCLEVLTLKRVIFFDNASAQQLFNSCPSLEELNLVHCDWTNVSAVSITCPLLSKITIRECRDSVPEDEDMLGAENYGPLDPNKEIYRQIVIFGPKLRSFAYDGDLIYDYFLYNTSAVDNVSIEISPMSFSKLKTAGYFVFKLLKAVPNVKKLTMSKDVAEALARTSFLFVHLPVFGGLTELCLNSGPVNLSLEPFLNILRNLHSLEIIMFLMGVSLPGEEDEEINMDPIPACFGTSLKKITIADFRGAKEEMNAIKYLMQVTPLLEKLSIYGNGTVFAFDAGAKWFRELYKQIEGFPRASGLCMRMMEIALSNSFVFLEQ